MNTITTSAVITGIRSKVDRSLGLSVATPELSSQEKTAFLDLQGMNVYLTIKPMDEESEPLNIEEKMEGKKPSERLRSVIFVLWNAKYREKYPDFDVYYKMMMEKFIDNVKQFLPEV